MVFPPEKKGKVMSLLLNATTHTHISNANIGINKACLDISYNSVTESWEIWVFPAFLPTLTLFEEKKFYTELFDTYSKPTLMTS